MKNVKCSHCDVQLQCLKRNQKGSNKEKIKSNSLKTSTNESMKQSLGLQLKEKTDGFVLYFSINKWD